MISNLKSSSNPTATKTFGGGVLSTSSSDSCSSSSSSGSSQNHGNSATARFDNGFSIYNKNIDFYESFRSYGTPAKEMSSVKQGQLKNDANSLVASNNNNNIVSNNNNNNNNLNSNIINNNTIVSNQKFKTTTTLVNDLNDLHNYSKSPNAIDEVPAPAPVKMEIKEEDELKEEDLNGELPEIRDDGDPDKTPDHHARRPMNAFLIFCKRHRSIVRDRHPNLENRSITKILGDWWANLDKEEKNCYTELAKMYKDAFFTANPNFKWYKLPAPPLRSLAPRPCNLSPSQEFNFDYSSPYFDSEPVTRQRHDSLNGVSNGRTSKNRKPSGVGQFKFADVAQMGGLSSLLNVSDATTPNDKGTNKDQSLQDALSETSSFISETMSPSRTEPFVNMRNHFGQSQQAFRVASNSATEISDSELARKWRIHEVPEHETGRSDFFDEEYYKKSSRSCKGKRYQEIMKSISKNGSPNKKLKVKHSLNFNGNGTENGFKHFEVGAVGMEVDVKDMSAEDQKEIDKKLFDASDFDLEEKIRALPALSLDDYLTRKRETKKTKKKLGGRKNKSVSKTEKQTSKHETNVSGSQKRKAPKESITRRAAVKDEDSNDAQIINIAAVPGSAAADLFTLAEVAVQKASIDKN